MGLLKGKVALVTGGARGQGRAHAVTCAREGANVVVLDVADQIETVPYELATQEDLAETVVQVEAVGGSAIAVQADARDQSAVDGVVARTIADFGRLDILIANHGIWAMRPFWELSDAEWDDMIGVNLTAVWRCAKAVAPHMIEREEGSIVVTSSVNGLEPGFNYTHYSTAKFGVIGLCKNIAHELAPHGVRCNAIAPGMIDTPMVDSQTGRDMLAGSPGGTREHVIQAGKHYHALKNAGPLAPQAVADAALWLNSELAAQVTGVTLPVDAGHMFLNGFNHSPGV